MFFCLETYFHLNKTVWGLDRTNTFLSDLFAVTFFFQELYEQHWSPHLVTKQIRPDSDCLNSTYILIFIHVILLSRELTHLFDDVHPYSPSGVCFAVTCSLDHVRPFFKVTVLLPKDSGNEQGAPFEPAK